MNTEKDIDVLILTTSLFEDAIDLLNTLRSSDKIRTEVIELNPERMAEADWDDVIHRSLRAKKVVTL